MKRIIKKIYAKFFFYIFKVIPLQKKVFFSCFSGKVYGDNPKIISIMLNETESEIKQIWVYHDKRFQDVPTNIKQVKWGTIKMIYELATSKVWIDSHTKPEWVLKRKKQYYINTWHGGLGIKKIEGDVKEKISKEYIERIKHNSKMIDLLISNSDWLTEIYKRAFWYNGRIEKIGYPKIDYLLNLPKGLKEKICKYYKLNNECNFILYVPTMRDNPEEETFYLDTKSIIEALQEKYGGQWKVILRLHPVDRKFIKNIQIDNNVIDATFYPDILELISASEILLTDYSSCIFDAAILRKKAIIFAKDEEKYDIERGLYIKIENLPFPVSRNNEELCKRIKEFDYDSYCHNIEKYFNQVGLIADGHATERIVQLIKEKIGE